MISQNTYNVGIYCRLSREDNTNQESMSIANQRQLLMDYVMKEGWHLQEVYVDDGLSGVSFDRPDFQRMIADVEHGKINCVITKDLSRLGRDHIKSGYYIEEFFPEHGVRFISVSESIDNVREDNDFTAFYHVFNEFYPKQVSKKVKQVKRNGAENGKFMGSHAPYGYQKSPEDKHKLIIDEYAASIVRRIFREYYGGSSARFIAETLTQDGIDAPRFYCYKKQNGQTPKPNEHNHWQSGTIIQMLRNPAYAGDMAQGKRRVKSFKTKKREAVPRENWIVVPNTHEAIIDRDMWNEIQARFAVNKQRVRKSKGRGDDVFGLFSGCLVCADCGSKLAYQSSPKSGAYRCSRYNNGGKSACASHYILEETLAELVLSDIRQYAGLAANDRDKLENELIQALTSEQNTELRQIESQTMSLESRMREITQTVKSLYEDKCCGTLTEALFRSLSADYAEEESELSRELEAAYERLRAQRDAQDMTSQFLERMQGCLEIKTLTREVIMALIDSITIGHATVASGSKTQSIRIQYKFIGNQATNAKEDIA